jgi:hypothetical protein
MSHWFSVEPMRSHLYSTSRTSLDVSLYSEFACKIVKLSALGLGISLTLLVHAVACLLWPCSWGWSRIGWGLPETMLPKGRCSLKAQLSKMVITKPSFWAVTMGQQYKISAQETKTWLELDISWTGEQSRRAESEMISRQDCKWGRHSRPGVS